MITFVVNLVLLMYALWLVRRWQNPDPVAPLIGCCLGAASIIGVPYIETQTPAGLSAFMLGPVVAVLFALGVAGFLRSKR